MWPFSKRQDRQPETLSRPVLSFLCEQDGTPERELKDKLCELFTSECDVKRAYLARVEYEVPRAFDVALCIRGAESPSLVRCVGEVFAGQFSKNEHLDILFLDDVKEAELRKVCQPFYCAGQPADGTSSSA